jgi:ubiquinone/menaquinone biosynthesis C-methylase UbiE
LRRLAGYGLPNPPAKQDGLTAVCHTPENSARHAMHAPRHIPDWLLPRGVPRGLWDYSQADHIARDYDAYFQGNTLFDFDLAVLQRHFTRPGVLVDLGCGTGRLLVPFARQGFACLAVDLSLPMLQVVQEKAARENLRIDPIQANLVQLDGLRDAIADYAICMFSTLGMIRGRDHRHQALCHFRRILRPGGLFVLHVHNRWSNLFHPAGRWWLLQNWFDSRLRKRMEPGDKFYDYRGIPRMFLHVWTCRELRRDLQRAGFRICEWIPLDTARRHALRFPWLLGRLRANGWIVVCQK